METVLCALVMVINHTAAEYLIRRKVCACVCVCVSSFINLFDPWSKELRDLMLNDGVCVSR